MHWQNSAISILHNVLLEQYNQYSPPCTVRTVQLVPYTMYSQNSTIGIHVLYHVQLEQIQLVSYTMYVQLDQCYQFPIPCTVRTVQLGSYTMRHVQLEQCYQFPITFTVRTILLFYFTMYTVQLEKYNKFPMLCTDKTIQLVSYTMYSQNSKIGILHHVKLEQYNFL